MRKKKWKKNEINKANKLKNKTKGHNKKNLRSSAALK